MSEQVNSAPQPPATKKRKWLWIAGVFVALLIIGAMSNNDQQLTDSGTKSEEKAAPVASTQTIYALNQDAPSGDVVWRVTKVTDRGSKLLKKDSRYVAIASDKVTQGKFIQVNITLENKGKDLASIVAPKLIDSQGREFTDVTFQVSEWLPEGQEIFLLSNLQPNLPKSFVLMYEVPADAQGLKLEVGVLKPQVVDLGM